LSLTQVLICIIFDPCQESLETNSGKRSRFLFKNERNINNFTIIIKISFLVNEIIGFKVVSKGAALLSEYLRHTESKF